MSESAFKLELAALLNRHNCENGSGREIGNAVAALTEAGEQGSGWQPIETAPKDGTQVWGWDEERGSNPMIWTDAEWVITYDDATIQPTHWMPLPEPPAALTEAGEGIKEQE